MATRKISTAAHRVGIGSEIISPTLPIRQKGGTQLNVESIEIGEQLSWRGESTGQKADKFSFNIVNCESTHHCDRQGDYAEVHGQ